MGRHAEIAAVLRGELERGIYPEGSRFPAECELADRFGVSTITVNKAVGLLVERGYLARSGSRRGGTVVRCCRVFPRGLIGFVGSLVSGFQNRILVGALNAAYREGYALIPVPLDPQTLEERLKQLSNGMLCGLLALTETRLTVPLPVVYMDKTNLDHIPGLCQVRCDSCSGGRMIAELLLKEGCRNPVYFHSHPDRLDQVARRRGFLEVLRGAGIPEPEKRFFSVPANTPHSYCRALEEMCRAFPGYTALACETDHCAFDMLRAGRKLGIDVGGKIRLTGFGNVREIQALFPFPTIEQHPEETGYRACLRLLELMEKPETPPFVEELPVELIVP